MKKLITIALTLLMVLSTTAGAFATHHIQGLAQGSRAIGTDEHGHTPEWYRMILAGEVSTVPTMTNTGGRMHVLNMLYGRTTANDIDKANSRFPDIDNHWGKQGIGTLTHLGIIDGFPNGTFRPNDTLTLDQFLKMVLEGMGHQLELGFQEYWAINYVNMAFEEGLVKVRNQGFTKAELSELAFTRIVFEDVDVASFDPDDHARFRQPITRQEMAMIISRAMLSRYFGADPTELELIERVIIKDIHSSTGDYFHYIAQAYAFGLLGGRSLGHFEPLAHLTRAEGATVIMRFLDEDIRETINPDLSHVKQVTLFTGWEDTWMTIYESYREPDIIDMLILLEGNQDNTLGFAGMGANPFESSTGFVAYRDEETWIKDINNPYENLADLMISIDKSENPQSDHEIALIDPQGAMERHQEIIRLLLEVAFEDDFDEVWGWFNDSLVILHRDGRYPVSVRRLNNRRVDIGGNLSNFAIQFSDIGGN